MIRVEDSVSSILVTCRNNPAVLNHYVPALRAGGWQGGVAILTPDGSEPIMALFAGVLLTGGADIHPRAWDPEEPIHPTSEVDGERDSMEFRVVREAWRQGLPIFGICRGSQTLNVALGGSLHQDIPSIYGCAPDLHRKGSSELPPELAHDVRIAPQSRLSALVGGTRVDVNSRHHQAVKRVAGELRAVAWHDGTLLHGEPLVEGVEAADPQRWAVGVQWHPENLVNLDHGAGRAALGLFRGFVEAVRG